MAAVSEDPITLWLKLGALEKLEQVVLDGYGDQLYGKTSRIPQVNKFLRQVPLYQSKIDEIHRAVAQGNLREVQHLIDRKKLAFCRDHMGASPMHKAVLFGQKQIIDYLLDRYPSVVHARDHRGRTPLHYAAVLPDGGETYRMLLDSGADLKATDVYGNRPEYYLQAQDELNLQILKEGATIAKIKKPKIKSYHINGHPRERGFSAKPAGSRVQIRELINNGTLESLEEIVIQGHGDRLLGETSPNPLVQDFLRMVPIYMERIYEVHRAVMRGRIRDVQTLLDRKKLALARDPLGATTLHKAVMYGHYDIAQYIAYNFPLVKDAKDLDGRTPLHYAAVLKDNHQIYNLLVSLGANTLVLDYRGKTPEYYLQFPDHLNLEQIIKQSQRANANYMANHTNRIKAISPKRRSPQFLRNAHIRDITPDFQHREGEKISIEELIENLPAQELPNGPVSFKLPKKILFRSQPLLPPPKLKRLEVNSANIRKWIKEEDLEKLEGAVLEGFGEKVAKERSDSVGVQDYITHQVPRLVERIQAIHSAVSNDDLVELQNQIEKEDFALAKDSMGMAPIHRAVLLNKGESLHFLIEKFPETVNAKDKEGRTALHYAAAMSRGGGSNSYRMLMEAGADARIRDNQGRSAEYYRTHHVPIPNKLSLQTKGSTKKSRSKSEPPPPRAKRAAGASLPPSMVEKITQSLQQGDAAQLRELVLDGYGKHLVGRTSWNEDVRQYLKTLPSYMATIESLFEATAKGDVDTVKRLVDQDENLLKAKHEDGSTVIHHAVLHDRMDVLNYFLEKHSSVINSKDRIGRTALHVAGQQKNHYIYTILTAAGADPKMLDQKGRTAEFYMNTSSKQNNHSRPQITPPEGEQQEGATAEKTIESNVEEVGSEKKEEKEEVEEEKPQVEEEREEEALPEAVGNEEGNEEKREEEEEIKVEEAEVEEQEGAGEELKQEDEERTESVDQDTSLGSTGDRLNELIDFWIKEKDLLRLEHVVIAGQGERLVGRSSDDRQVQEFLDLVPTYMARIRGVHDAVVRGNLGEVEAVLTRKRFALSRDHLGASPLHLAVLHGHTDIVRYIISNFPEALDGPDNEGRTPLHYAAIMKDGGHYYKLLKIAGADDTATDKAGKTAEHYMIHPGELTIRDLLEGYRIVDSEEKPIQVNIWQRPPTEEIEKQLTPPSSGSQADADDEDEDDDEEEDRRETTEEDKPEREDETTENNSMVDTVAATTPGESRENSENTLYPILFDQQNRDSRYLANVLGDALVKGLTNVAQKRPDDPVGYLATWLYQYASRSSRGRSRDGYRGPEVHRMEREEENPATGRNSRSNGNRTPRSAAESRKEELLKSPLGVLEEEPMEDADEDEVTLEFEDHTKMKDEEGQTVLHFAASRVHPDGSFYGLISHAEVLLAERDSSYRTARDMAEEVGQQENVAAIDRYVLDAFLQQRSAVIQMLVHEGYDHVLNISDSRGRDIATVLQLQHLNGSMALLRDIADFIKLRDELHTFVRHSYLEGVCGLVRADHSLVTAKNSRARCALHVAVLFEHLDIIEALVKASSSAVHVPDNLGRTPLHYAMATRKVDQIARILIKAGAMRSTRDVKMRTPSYFFIYKQEIQKIYEEESRLA